ncbi:MAG: GNAT family N-acetyltransferase [Planctomycetota bacterium]
MPASGPAPIEIARLEEARMERAMRELVDICEDFAGGVMCRIEPGAFDNLACNIGLHGPVDGAEIERFFDFFEPHGIEPKAEVSAFADLTLVRGLSERGMQVREFTNVFARAMGSDIDNLAPQHGWPTDEAGTPLTIHGVDPSDESEIVTSATITGEAFYPEPEPLTPKRLEMHRRICAHPRSEVLIARFGDEAVGVAGAEHPADPDDPPVSALFAAAVREPWRRRGVQQALLAHRLKTALASGARIATIHANPGIPTERNAARLGFRLGYTKVVMVRPGQGLAPSP